MYLDLASEARSFLSDHPSSEGFKGMCFSSGYFHIVLTAISEYWINLGKSTVFQGHTLLDCVSRIHQDITEVWNFDDPDKVSSEYEFPHDSFGHFFQVAFRRVLLR